MKSHNILILPMLLLMCSSRCNDGDMSITETERLFNEVTHEHTEHVVFLSATAPLEFLRTIPQQGVADTIRIGNAADNISQLRHNEKAARVFLGIMDTSVVSVVRFWERENSLNNKTKIRSVFFTFRQDSLYVDGEAEFTNEVLTSFYFKECTMTGNTFDTPIYEYWRVFSSNRFFH